MLKVLLYGLATFMETGIGVWIFSQTFSERRILEKKYYVLVLYPVSNNTLQY